MKILMLTENDPAGCAILFRNAIEEYTEHSCRLITQSEKSCYSFDKDIHIPDIYLDSGLHVKESNIEELLKTSDIFHFHILSDESMQLGPFKVADYIKGKAIAHHHHGHPDFRKNPEKYRLKYHKLGRKMLVSTPDLLIGLPAADWMPNLVPIMDPLYMPTEERYPEFTVGHSPTRTDIKDTVTLLEAVHMAGVNVDIIMNTDHKECLRRKQKCHVIFDHLQGYYGVSSLEGLSMGKWVISELSDLVAFFVMQFAETETLPWLSPLRHGGLSHLLKLLERAGTSLNRNFMVNHWSDKKVVNRLIKFYEGL